METSVEETAMVPYEASLPHEAISSAPTRTRTYEVTPWELLLDSDPDDAHRASGGKASPRAYGSFPPARVSYSNVFVTLANQFVSRVRWGPLLTKLWHQ
jgi:hypothetical protein